MNREYSSYMVCLILVASFVLLIFSTSVLVVVVMVMICFSGEFLVISWHYGHVITVMYL